MQNYYGRKNTTKSNFCCQLKRGFSHPDRVTNDFSPYSTYFTRTIKNVCGIEHPISLQNICRSPFCFNFHLKLYRRFILSCIDYLRVICVAVAKNIIIHTLVGVTNILWARLSFLGMFVCVIWKRA